MSDHALAIAAFIFTALMFVLAIVGLGVALLTVPNHPDRAKYAKACFDAAALLSLLAASFFTVLVPWGLSIRLVLGFVWLAVTTIGLNAGFQFANRSSLAELGIPSSALTSEPLVPRNKKLMMLMVVVIILAATAGLNALREPDISGGWISAQALSVWGAPWKWVLPAMLLTAIVSIPVGFFIAQRKGQTEASGGLQFKASGTVNKPCSYQWAHDLADSEVGRIRDFVEILRVGV